MICSASLTYTECILKSGQLRSTFSIRNKRLCRALTLPSSSRIFWCRLVFADFLLGHPADFLMNFSKQQGQIVYRSDVINKETNVEKAKNSKKDREQNRERNTAIPHDFCFIWGKNCKSKGFFMNQLKCYVCIKFRYKALFMSFRDRKNVGWVGEWPKVA